MINEKQIKARFQQKHDIEANWNLATNFIPKNGEIIIYDKDSNYNYSRIKIGDGITSVINLDFVNKDIYTIEGGITKAINGSVSITLFKNGEVATDSVYLINLVSSAGDEWREHSSSKGWFIGTKSWNFSGNKDGIAWRCLVYEDTTKNNLLASASFVAPAVGEDGYSPVRGTDYWTDADKAEIKSYVDEAILGGAW